MDKYEIIESIENMAHHYMRLAAICRDLVKPGGPLCKRGRRDKTTQRMVDEISHGPTCVQINRGDALVEVARD
jgi:hypothetical protein